MNSAFCIQIFTFPIEFHRIFFHFDRMKWQNQTMNEHATVVSMFELCIFIFGLTLDYQEKDKKKLNELKRRM